MNNEKLYYIIDRLNRSGEEEVLKIEVKILRERSVFGRDEVEITPVAGSGAWWIKKDKIIRK